MLLATSNHSGLATIQRARSEVPTTGFDRGGLASTETEAVDPWKSCQQELDGLKNLQDDWDGDGAKAPSHQLIASAENLVRIIRMCGIQEPPRISVGPSGTVVLSWHNREHYFEINVIAPFKLRWMMALSMVRPEHGDELDARMFRMLQLTLSL